GAENAHAVELTFGREGTDDAGARRSVAAEVALLGRLDRNLVVLPALDRDGPCERTDERVVRLDPAVEDADADAAPRRISPGPLTGDPRRPLDPRLTVRETPQGHSTASSMSFSAPAGRLHAGSGSALSGVLTPRARRRRRHR